MRIYSHLDSLPDSDYHQSMSKQKSNQTTYPITVKFEGIEELRKRHNLTVKRMSEIIGIAPTNYTRLARDPSAINFATLSGIINGFKREFNEDIDFGDILQKVPQSVSSG